MNARVDTGTKRRKPRATATSSKKPSRDAKPGTEPLVTIVISFRERWRFTPRTVESILRNSNGAFALWLLDSGIPDDIRAELKPRIDAGDLELVAVDGRQQPNQWRAQIAPRLKSPYAVFIDNDVVVMPGWLERMVACAEETRAGIVCPLYLWGDREESDVIHMAGGDLTLEPTDQGVRMTESHRHVGRRISEVPQDLQRKPCGFGEFHCLMMRREIYSAPGTFDPGIVTVHEHIHATMLARELGYETWFEPDARVNYLAFVPWQVGELPALRSRWDFATAERSLEQFAKRWKVIDDEDYRTPIRQFLAMHAGHTDLIDPRPRLAARREQLLTKADLQPTWGGLQWLAHTTGYDLKDIRLLHRGYRLAVAMMDGLYRPCGRPFINHVTSTASVLLFYGCPIPHALAALLHAAHTHGPKASVERWLANFRDSSPEAKTAAAMVDAYGERVNLLEAIDLSGSGIDALALDTASLILLDAANEIDMHQSLEVAVCGRTDVLAGKRLADTLRLLDHIGLPGMAGTLRRIQDEPAAIPAVPFQKDLHMSFRMERPEAA